MIQFQAALVAGALLSTFPGTTQAQPAPGGPPKKVLVVSVTEGFRHSNIPLSNKILADLGKSSGAFTVDIADVDPNAPELRGADGKPDKQKFKAANAKVLAEKMSPEALKGYDAVIFNSTTGDLPVPDMDAFLKWIESGKGFAGFHAATDTFDHHVPTTPYVGMIGGEFKTHGPQVEVEVINQDPAHAACTMYPATFHIFDEIYQMTNFYRGKIHGLLTMDKHPNNKTPGDYPVSWCKKYGQGKVFYTSLGHREDVWDPTWGGDKRTNKPEIAKDYQKHVLGGVLWVLGLAPGDAAPQATALP